MDQWERDGLRAANNGIRNQVEHILDAFAQQRVQQSEVFEKLAAVRATARSADGLVEVTVNSAGVLTDVQFSAQALRSTLEKLGESVTEAGREAARLAQLQNQEIITPITAAADGMPDLPDLLPGAPSLRELRESWNHDK